MPQPKPSDDAPNRKRDLVTKFREEYQEAYDAVLLSAEHTATEGWQKLYRGTQAEDLAERRMAAATLRATADLLEQRHLTEDEFKIIQGTRKSIDQAMDSAASFQAQVIDPIVAPVLECEKIRTRFAQAARNAEAAQPLIEAGLEEVMLEAIKAMPKPAWDERTGIVTA